MCILYTFCSSECLFSLIYRQMSANIYFNKFINIYFVGNSSFHQQKHFFFNNKEVLRNENVFHDHIDTYDDYINKLYLNLYVFVHYLFAIINEL